MVSPLIVISFSSVEMFKLEMVLLQVNLGGKYEIIVHIY
jgi:hypothetical protein